MPTVLGIVLFIHKMSYITTIMQSQSTHGFAHIWAALCENVSSDIQGQQRFSKVNLSAHPRSLIRTFTVPTSPHPSPTLRPTVFTLIPYPSCPIL